MKNFVEDQTIKENLSTYAILKADKDRGAWTTGNTGSSVFSITGSMTGTFVKKNPTSPLNGKFDYKFTQAAGSLYDFALSPIKKVPGRARGGDNQKYNQVSITYKYNGNKGDIQVILYDVDNSVIRTPDNCVVDAKGNDVGELISVFSLPSNTTKVRFGYWVKVANSGKIFQFDDVQIGVWTPQVVNLVEQQSTEQLTTSSMTYSGNFALFPSMTHKGSGIYSVSTVSSHTRFTFLKNAIVSGGVMFSLTSGGTAVIFKNGTNILQGSTSSTAGYQGDTPFSISVNAGDYLEFGPNTNQSGTTGMLTLTATAISENIIQSWKAGTEPTSFTPTGSWTTNTTYSGTHQITQDGRLHVEGKVAVTGAPTSAALTVNLPNGYVIDTVKQGGTDNRELGRATILDSGSTYYQGRVQYENTTSVRIVADSKFSTTNYSEYVSVSQAVPMTWANGDYVTFSYDVYVVGVSSLPKTIALPTATDIRNYIIGAGNATQSLTANTTDIPFIATTQSNLVWDGSGLSAPEDGDYEISGTVKISSANTFVVSAYVDGTISRAVGSSFGTTLATFSGVVSLLKGQRVSLRSDQNVTLVNSATLHTIRVNRLHGKNNGGYIVNGSKEQVAYIKDVKSSGTDAGSSVATTWTTRTLNTIEGDSSIVSLSSNQITLQAGEYVIKASAPFYATANTRIRLRNITDGTTAILGDSQFFHATNLGAGDCLLSGKLILTSPKTFELQYYAYNVKTTNGLGVAVTSSGELEVYSVVEIIKLNGY